MQRALSWVLAALLCLSLLPMGALADEASDAALALAEQAVAEAFTEEPVSEPEPEPVEEPDTAEALAQQAVEAYVSGTPDAEPTVEDEAPVEAGEAVPELDGASAAQIKQQIKDTYTAALKASGRSSFKGYCADYVNRQLVVLGINKSYVGGNGKDEFDNYKNKTKSTGGYAITAYPASSYTLSQALNTISNNGKTDVYNILIGFEKASGSYGHTCFIHAILGGTVYWSDSFAVTVSGTKYTEGSPIAASISTFSSLYSSSLKYVLDGVIYFGVGATTKPTGGLTISDVTAPEGTLKKGSSFGLRGIISSGNTITNVSAYIYDAAEKATKSYSKNPNSTRYNIQTDGLNNAFTFGSLDNGSYKYVVTATDSTGTKTLINTSFVIGYPTTYTVLLNTNGGSSDVPRYQTKTHGTNLTLTSTKPTRTGYAFQGWAASASATSAEYQPGGSYSAEGDVTLYAVWIKNVLTFKYNANGGTVSSGTYSATSSGMIQRDSSDVVDKWDYGYCHPNGLYNASTFGLSRAGYTFVGWSLSKDGSSTVFNQDDATATADRICPSLKNGNASVTLYAIWKQNAVTPTPAPSGAQLTVSGATAAPGSEVRLTASIKNNPGFMSMSASVSYDSAVLELTGISADGQLLAGVVANTATGKISFSNATNVTGDGVLLTLTFKVRDKAAEGPTKVDIAVSSMVNEALENIRPTVTAGTVTVASALLGDVSGDGKITSLDAALIKRYEVGLITADKLKLAAADVSGDGKYTSLDAALIQRYEVGLITKFPAQK